MKLKPYIFSGPILLILKPLICGLFLQINSMSFDRKIQNTTCIVAGNSEWSKSITVVNCYPIEVSTRRKNPELHKNLKPYDRVNIEIHSGLWKDWISKINLIPKDSISNNKTDQI